MALRFVLDEHLRGPLWRALPKHNAAGILVVDVERVGDPPGLPLASPDTEVLLWSARNDRLLLTRDWNTMPGFLADLLRQGFHSPGVLLLRDGFTLAEWVEHIAHGGDPTEYQDQAQFVP